jgi:thiol-disulfide isomerase/thioredoxin
MRRTFPFGRLIVGVLFPLASISGTVLAAEIKLEKIKAGEVEKAVATHKGQVVVVDVWGEFCAPCKKHFPHLVKLHKEFAKDGLVCISLSVDLEENYQGALDFLKKNDADFRNYILWDNDDNKDKLDKTFTHAAPPIFHVFDKTGKRIKTWEGRIEEEAIDKLVKELLQQK